MCRYEDKNARRRAGNTDTANPSNSNQGEDSTLPPPILATQVALTDEDLEPDGEEGAFVKKNNQT